MKKGLFGIFIILLSAYILKDNLSVFQGETIDSGFVFDSSYLKNQIEGELEGAIDVNSFEKGAPIYTKNDEVIIGENNLQKKGNIDFPLFLNNGKILYFLNDFSNIIDENFNEIKSSKDTLISQGILFDRFGNSKTIDKYIFAKLSNGLYINLLDFNFTNNETNFNVPSNSIIQFKESEIKYYIYENEKLNLKSIINMMGSSRVKIGDIDMNYIDFLTKMGLYNAPSEGVIAKDNNNDDGKEKSNYTSINNKNNNFSNNINFDDSKNTSPSLGEGTSIDNKYIKPIVEVGEMTPNYYSIDTSLKIEDPQKHIDRSVFISVKKGKELILNIPINKTGGVEVKGLEPGTEYDVEVNYKYKEENGSIANYIFPLKKIITKNIENLEGINISYDIDGIYSNEMIVKKFTNNTILPLDIQKNISKIIINFNSDLSYVLPMNLMNDFFNRKGIDFSTGNILNSNTNYLLSIEVLDIFNNKLKVFENPNYNMQYKTAKETPSIRSSNVVGNFDSIDFSYIINNKDHAIIKGLSYKLLLGDSVVQENEMSLESQEVTINNIISKTNYRVEVYGVYNIENGEGFIESKLGEFNTVSAPLDVLGKVSINGNFIERTSRSLKYNYNVNTNITNIELIKMISSVKVELIDNSNNQIIKNYSLNSQEVKLFKEGKPLTIESTDLKPNNLYSINIIPIVEEEIKETNIKVTYVQGNKQYTFKVKPYVTFSNQVYHDDRYSFNLSIIDNYDTINNDEVTINLINLNTKEVIESFKTNQINDIKLEYTILDRSIEYGVVVLADKYNIGQGNGTLESDKEIGEMQKLVDDNPLFGKINLQELSITNQVADTRINFVVDNRSGFIKNDTAYILLKEDNKVIDTIEVNVLSGEIINQDHIYNLDVNRDYSLELYTQIGDKKFVLGNDYFDTNKNVYTISNESELYAVSNDLTANYRVVNDITLKERTIIEGPFMGNINFNGHKITLGLSGRKFLFNEIGETGSINNIKYIITDVEFRGPSSLVNINNGNISNIIGINNFKLSATYRFDIASLFNINNGKITNFVIHNENILIGENANAGLGVYNNGMVNNGYTFGANIQNSEGGSTPGEQRYVGGIIAKNSTTGIIKNVFSNITTTTKKDRLGAGFGSIVGKNEGLVENSYSYSTGKNNVDPVGGPGIGTNEGKVINNFYYSIDQENNNYNKKFGGLVDLYAPSVINPIINKENNFIVDKFLLNNYYPQIRFDGYMPKQELVPLPNQDLLRDIDIVSASRTSIDEKRQKANVDIIARNINEYKIESISIGGTITKVKSQNDKDGFSTISVEVSADNIYIDEYNISSIVYFNGNFFDSVVYKPGEREVFLGFYDNLLYPQQLAGFNPRFNYLMMNNISLSDNSFNVSEEYTGNFDGNGYTLSNISNTNYNIFNSIKGGTIKNVKFSNITLGNNNINVPSEVGIVGVSNNSVYEDVVLNNLYLFGGTNTGGLIGNSNTDVLLNVGLGNIEIKLVKDAIIGNSIGSLIGIANDLKINNYYVQNSKINSDLSPFTSIGGLIGILNNGTITDGYVSNVKINLPFGLEVGGVIGSIPKGVTTISNMYAYGIISSENYVAAVVGNNNAHNLSLNRILSLYNVSSTGLINSPLVNGIIEGNSFIDIFNTNISLVNGGNKPDDNITTLSIKDFTKKETYHSTIGFGDLYDYNGVEKLKLPLVYNNDKSKLIEGQELIEIEYNDFYLESHEIIKQTNQGVTIRYDMSNPKNYVINEFQIKDMQVVNNIRVVNQEEGIYEQDYIPLKYLDRYSLVGINYTVNNNQEIMNLNNIIDMILYKEIWDVDTYNKLKEMPNENAIIMANLDFYGEKIETNLVLNRLTSKSKTISNINSNDPLYSEINYLSEVNYTNLIINNYFIFDKINHEMKNVNFTDVIIDATAIQGTDSTNKGVSSVKEFGKNAKVKKIKFKNVDVLSRQNNNAILLGQSIELDIAIDEVIIENSTIEMPYTNRGNNGGIIGSSINSTESISNSKIDKLDIKNGWASNGGIVGTMNESKTTITDSTVSNLSINHSPKGEVGGLIGFSRGLPIISNSFVNNFTAIVSGSNVGGLIGYMYYPHMDSKITNVGISKSNIESANDYVGGLIGYKNSNSFLLDNAYVDNVNVKGVGYVGGLIGSDYYGAPTFNNIFINANVIGKTNTGLLAGYLWYSEFNNIILTGNITVENDFATFFGQIGASGIAINNSIIAPENISSPSGLSYQKGGGYSRFGTNYIYGQSQITDNLNSNLVQDLPNNTIPEGSKFQMVDRKEMNNSNFYLNKNYLLQNWNFNNVQGFNFPQVSNQLGEILPGQSIVSLPNPKIKNQNKNASLEYEKNSLPGIDIYPSGVNTINIDFEEVHEGLHLELSVGEDQIYNDVVKEKTISFIYDYTSPIQVEVNNEIGKYVKKYKSEDFSNDISIVNNEAYYIEDEKLYRGSNIINENVLNIYGDKALLSSGGIIELTNLAIIEKENKFRVIDPVPLYKSEEFQVFGTYSIRNDVVKDGILVYNDEIIKYTKKIKINQFIIGEYNDNYVLSVLDKSGILRDIKTPIKIPKGFNKKNILNLYSYENLVIVKYNNGKIILFNYQTGELIFENKKEIKKDFFEIITENIERILMVDENEPLPNLEYIKMSNLEKALENNSITNQVESVVSHKGYKNKYIVSFDFDNEEYIIYNDEDVINGDNEVLGISHKDSQNLVKLSMDKSEEYRDFNFGNIIFLIFFSILFILFRNKNKMM